MQKQRFIPFMLLIFLFISLIGTSFAQGGVVPDPDPDKDGLPNSIDECDNRPGPREYNGCPEAQVHATDVPPPDSDGDGTADPLDRCPNEAGDGANGGCPAGSDGSAPEATPNTLVLEPAPTEGDCVVSTGGTSAINMRVSPSTESGIIAILPPNEWLIVLAVFDAPAALYNEAMDGAPSPFLAGFPLSMDAGNETWYLVQKVSEPLSGWVSEAVIRFGGECQPFNIAEKKKGPKKDEQAYLVVKMEDILISSYQTSGSEGDEEEGNGFVIISIIGILIGMREVSPDNPSPLPEADFYLFLGGIEGDTSGDPVPTENLAWNFVKVELLEEGCELSEDENGLITPNCEDGGMPSSLPICTHQELNEAGRFDESCYQVEIPEGCAVDTSEAGRWRVTCEDQGDGVQITPIGETEPILDVLWYGDNTVAIGMLLPAVQKVREAAARIE
jgi:hypothetical protein